MTIFKVSLHNVSHIVFYPPAHTQMETGESVSEASRDVPVLPNGSSMTSIKNEVQSDKLTSEKLQEIEDEEILDKMVLYFSSSSFILFFF